MRTAVLTWDLGHAQSQYSALGRIREKGVHKSPTSVRSIFPVLDHTFPLSDPSPLFSQLISTGAKW